MSADTEQKKQPGAISEEQADALSAKFTASWETDEPRAPDPASATPEPKPAEDAVKPGGIPLKKTMLGLAPYSGEAPAPAGPPAQQPGSSSPFDAAAAALAATHPFPTAEAGNQPRPASPEPTPESKPSTPQPTPSSAGADEADAAPAKPAIPRQRTLVGIQAPDDEELEKLAESFADAPDPTPRSSEPTPSVEAAKQAPVASAAAVVATPTTPEPVSSPEYAPPSTPPASGDTAQQHGEGSIVVDVADGGDDAAQTATDQERAARRADTLPPVRGDTVAVDVPADWAATSGSKKKGVILAVAAAALLGTVGLLAALGGDEGTSEPESAKSATGAATEPAPSPAPTASEAAPADSVDEASATTPDTAPETDTTEDEPAEEPAEEAEAAPTPAPAPKPAAVAPKPKPKPVRTTKPKRTAKKTPKKNTPKKKPSIVRDAPF